MLDSTTVKIRQMMNNDPPAELVDTEADALTDARQRYLLYTLFISTPPLGLADIAHLLARWEAREDAEDYLDRRLRIYMSLYHDHLPALLDAGLVEYDQNEDTVDLTSRGRQAEPLLFEEFEAEIEAVVQSENRGSKSPRSDHKRSVKKEA